MKTKESIDKHAKIVLSSSQGNDGKHAYNLARLYFEAGCFEDAKSYINCYLQSFGNSDWRAHKLLADIENAEGCYQDALHTYKDVLRLQPECKDALIKVALLTAKLHPVEQGEKWLKEVEKRYPCDSSISEITKLLSSRKSGNHLASLRQKAESNPSDVDVQCQYVNELINASEFRQAFDCVSGNVGMFKQSLQWQRISLLALENFMATTPSSDKEKVGNFMILTTYFRQLVLMAATAPINSIKMTLQKLDRGLYRFMTGYGIQSLDDSTEIACCAKEMSACLLTAVVLTVNKLLLQKSFSLSTVDILLISLCRAGLKFQPHRNNLAWIPNSFSFNKAATSGSMSSLFESSSTTIWNVLSAERILILSHVLESVKKTRCLEDAVLANCKLESVKEQLLSIVYPASATTTSSFLACYSRLLDPIYPNVTEFDHANGSELHLKNFFKQNYDNVDLVAWMVLSRCGFPAENKLGSDNLRWMVSEKLPVSEELNANRVSNVDLQAFALAIAFWIGENLKYYNKAHPFLPPFPLVCSASVPEQSDSWRLLMGVSSGGSKQKTTPRHTNQTLHAIRATAQGLPLSVLVSLAKSFALLGKSVSDEQWTEVYKEKSVHYWEKALPSLKTISRGQSSMIEFEQERNNRLFPVTVLASISPDSAKQLLEEATLSVAVWHRGQGHLDASLSCLQVTQTDPQSVSPLRALLKAEVAQEKSLVESEDRESQREMLTTSFGEISSILKRRDLPLALKKEAHKQLNSVVSKLTELDKLDQLEAHNSSGAQKTEPKNSEVVEKLESVCCELSSLNSNIHSLTHELRVIHTSYADHMKELTSLINKLIIAQTSKHSFEPNMQATSSAPVMIQGPPRHMFPQNPALPGQHAPQTLNQPPVVMPHAQAQFLPANNVAPFRFPTHPMGNAQLIPGPSANIGQKDFGHVITGQNSVVPLLPQGNQIPSQSLFPSMIPQTSPPKSEVLNASNPMLSSLLKPPSSEIEKKLNQPFQPPKLSSVEHAQDSHPTLPKDVSNPSSNLLTSTPKQPFTFKASTVDMKATDQSKSASQDSSTKGQPFASAGTSNSSATFAGLASKKSLFNEPTPVNAASTAAANVPTSTAPFSSLFAPKNQPTGQQLAQPFSFNAFGQSKPAAAPFSFKMPATVTTFATPSNVFSPPVSSQANVSAPVFTGFKGLSQNTSGSTNPSPAFVTQPKPAENPVFAGFSARKLATDEKSKPDAPKQDKGESSFEFKPMASTGTSASNSTETFSFSLKSKTATPEKAQSQSGAVGGSVDSQEDKKGETASPGGSKQESHDDSTHDPQFEPIVHLDQVAEITTGEETESSVFCERAKLFRLVEKEWKERGTGEMKILKKTRRGEGGDQEVVRYRVVMRRDQVKKLCANHVITDELSIKRHPTNEKMLVWIANDFAEDEEKVEQLCVRFKTPEIASRFKQVFEEGIDMYKAGGKSAGSLESGTGQKEVVKGGSDVETVGPKELSSGDSAVNPFSKFGLKADEWECKVCLVRNKQTDSTCVSCQNPNLPSSQPNAKPKPTSTLSSTSINPNNPLSKFQLKPGQWSCEICLTQNSAEAINCAACETPKEPGSVVPDSSKTVFGSSNQPKGPVFKFETNSQSSGSGFKFGTTSGAPAPATFKFGLNPAIESKTENDGKLAENEAKPIPKDSSKGFALQPQDLSAKDENAKENSSEKPGLFEGFKGFGLQNNSGLGFGSAQNQGSTGSADSSKPATTTSSLFASATVFGKPTTTNSLFGQPSSGASSLFGGTTTSAIFGKSSAAASGSVFGKSAGNSGSIFDRPPQKVPENELSRDDAERCGVTFEDCNEDEEEEEGRYYCEDAEDDYHHHSTCTEEEVEEEGDQYEEESDFLNPEEGHLEGEGQEYDDTVTNLDSDSNLAEGDVYIMNTPMRLATSSRSMFQQSPMARFDPNDSAGTPPQINSVFKPPAPAQLPSNAILQSDKGENDDELEIVMVRTSESNPEFRESVNKYKLPALFYDYMTKPDCTGCIGCGDDPKLSNRQIYKSKDADVNVKESESSSGVELQGERNVDCLDASKTSGFLFGNKVSTEFSFSSLANNALDPNRSFGFKGATSGLTPSFAPKPLFSSSMAHKKDGGEGEGESGDVSNSEECDVHFKPIVQLTKVDVKSGDETDEVVFAERAKLFRFTAGEWKERGVGELKVSRYVDKNVGRVIMRRDVILKLCANHVIFKDMNLAPMPGGQGKAFIWAARDFADDEAEGNMEKFAVRFKNADIAKKFEESFNAMRDLTPTDQ